MAINFSDDARSAQVDAVSALFDEGSIPGAYIEIRTGTQPTLVEDAATGTLLATLTMGNPAFGAASTGIAYANTIAADTSANATGTAGWFRCYDGDAAAIMDGTAGESGTDLILSSASITAGQTVSVTSFELGTVWSV